MKSGGRYRYIWKLKPGFHKANRELKDVQGWQFLTMKAAETLCIARLPPGEHIS